MSEPEKDEYVFYWGGRSSEELTRAELLKVIKALNERMHSLVERNEHDVGILCGEDKNKKY